LASSLIRCHRLAAISARHTAIVGYSFQSKFTNLSLIAEDVCIDEQSCFLGAISSESSRTSGSSSQLQLNSLNGVLVENGLLFGTCLETCCRARELDCSSTRSKFLRGSTNGRLRLRPRRKQFILFGLSISAFPLCSADTHQFSSRTSRYLLGYLSPKTYSGIWPKRFFCEAWLDVFL
jgi:hypothetical protein